jgi:hypothetical protein
LSRLLIGIPARNEADGIVDLAQRLERGAASIADTHDIQLALAYQPSDDDTLARFRSRVHQLPQIVLESSPATVGKGANVKHLVRRAVDDGDDYLLLVDADLAGYDPSNVARAVTFAEQHHHALVLPLWSRPPGQGNTTNYLVCPLLFATYRARVRQPIAGHMLLHRSLLDRLDVDALPDDFGVDIMITLAALASDLPVGQVALASPDHPSKPGNSERVMTEVAAAALRAVACTSAVDRPDVSWPERYWDGWEWPRNRGIEPDYVDVILRRASSESELERWLAFGNAGDEPIAEMWCDHLAEAVRQIRSPHPDLDRVVDDLVCPFFVHSEHRARRATAVAELEEYVAELGLRLAARLHG